MFCLLILIKLLRCGLSSASDGYAGDCYSVASQLKSRFYMHVVIVMRFSEKDYD